MNEYCVCLVPFWTSVESEDIVFWLPDYATLKWIFLSRINSPRWEMAFHDLFLRTGEFILLLSMRL
jgi:hypothetical protein